MLLRSTLFESTNIAKYCFDSYVSRVFCANKLRNRHSVIITCAIAHVKKPCIVALSALYFSLKVLVYHAANTRAANSINLTHNVTPSVKSLIRLGYYTKINTILTPNANKLWALSSCLADTLLVFTYIVVILLPNAYGMPKATSSYSVKTASYNCTNMR